MHTEGYKYKEIAQNLNLKIGTVKSRIFFARRKLMATLNAYQ
jgi:RNA polymerase sigma-70 factor, ECF subfamily